MEECRMPSPFPLFIKRRVGDRPPRSANPATRGAGNRDRPAAPTSDGPVSRLHHLLPQVHEGRVANEQNRGDG